MNRLTKKIISTFISLALVFCANGPAFSFVEKPETDIEYLSKMVINRDILNYFKITSVAFKSDSKSFVIWIQDLHNDYAIQDKIYKALESFTKKYDFEIYSEGVIDSTLDVSLLNSIPDKRIKTETINTLFKDSVLSACEYFALSNPGKDIKGIEDKKEYVNNLLLLEKINKNKNFNDYIVNNIIEQVNELKQQNIIDRVLSLQVLKLNEANIPNDFPNLQKYQIVSKKLSDINLKKLNSQFKNFVSSNQHTIAFYDLLKLKSNYGYAQIYDYIDSKLPEVKQDKNNRELIAYLESNKLLSEVNSVDLLYEKESFITGLLNKASLDQKEKEIIDLETYVHYLKDLVNTNILPSHYTSLRENKKYFSELLQKYLSGDSLVFALYLLNDKDLFDFFDTNLERNEIFVNNLLKTESNKIIIAGGFHSDITNKLKDLNVSYAVLTPNINLTNAFNNLFSTTLKYGSDEQVATNLLSIISSWKIFFTDTKSFQNEINEWIAENDELKDKLSVNIESANDGSTTISVSYDGATVSKVFNESKIRKIPVLSKKQQNLLVDEIIKVAKQRYLFGDDVEVKISDDDSLLDNMIPMSVKNMNGKPVIFVNKKFVNALYSKSYLIQPAVKLLHYSSLKIADTDAFISFVSTNYEDLQAIYEITTGLKQAKPSLLFTIKERFKHVLNTIKESISNFKKISLIKEPAEEDLKTEDEKNMAQALKQATLARKTRSFFVSFIQPPIGAYLVNADGITGRNYNNTNSVLHAETLTFVDFLKNYIERYESTPFGTLTEKGQFLTALLNAVVFNGQNVDNRIFQDRPALLENIGRHINYPKDPKDRDVKTVFEESNAVLKFVNEELGNPLSTATLYCTLAPCNKCATTMSELGISRLVYGSYSVNKSHTSINNILNAGIKVVDGVLQKLCDARIVNYRLMNLYPYRTNIASKIQDFRRNFSNLRKKVDKNIDYLVASIISVETKTLDLKYKLIDLQMKLNWGDLQSDPKMLDLLIETLKSVDAYDDVVKRASVMYVLRNKCEVKIEKGNIVFYNNEGKKLDFYINVVGKMVVSKNYSDKMNELAMVRNFADMDNNLAVSGAAFSRDMQAIFSMLSLYGIGQIIPVTGNTLAQTEKRLNDLGPQILSLLPGIYVENATMQYRFRNGEYINNEEYMRNIARAVLDPEVMSYLKDLFGNMQNEWFDCFVFFMEQTKELRKKQDVTYEDFVGVLLREQPDYGKFEHTAKIWGGLTREQAKNELERIYDTAIKDGTEIEKFKSVMKTFSLLELARLYFSDDPADQAEVSRLQKDMQSVEKGEDLNISIDSSVRYVVTSFRPTLVREQVTKYYERIIHQKYPDLEVISTGQTTISICKKGVDKTVPLREAMMSGTSVSDIIFSGDEFTSTGVDYPIYLLQQRGNGYMTVINTSGDVFSDDMVISLSNVHGFPSGAEDSDNVRRNLLLQMLILSIVEENIGLIATDPGYTPKNIAQELKDKIYTQNIFDLETETKQSEIPNIFDMLKAG